MYDVERRLVDGAIAAYLFELCLLDPDVGG